LSGNINIIINKHIRSNLSLVTSILIHEYGHAVIFHQGKIDHSEEEAWDMGKKSVPSHLIPNDISRRQSVRLKTYK